MREKLKTLPLTELKAIARSQGMKGVSTMRKNDLIDLLCERAKELEEEKASKARQAASGDGPAGAQAPESAAEPAAETYAYADTAPDTVPAGGWTAGQAGNGAINQPGGWDADRTGSAAVPQTGTSAGQGESGAPAPRENFRRNDGQNRGPRTGGRPSFTRQPYGYRGDAGRANQPAGRSEAPRVTVPQESAAAETPRPEGSKVPASSITPQIQAQFPDQTIQDIIELDSGVEANGILEVMPDGFGFIRCENFLPGENDVYVAPSQIRRFNLKTGDILTGNRRVKTASEKFAALLYVRSVNGYPPSVIETRPSFEKLTPVFPYERLHMETPGRPNSTAMRVLDLLAPIGKGQRGMIVSPPKAGKTTLLKQVAQAVTTNHPDMHLIILLIDERPEEVTDIRESVTGKNVEVIFSTFDELPERHKRVSEMVVERARRLVEHGRDVIILLDSITRLARAYNIVVPPSGRTLSGGMDPAALHMPKRFFGAARKMREGGSLTILATALVNTGSRMDDVVYEEFKGTGNMELVLDRKLSEKRIFPAIDILKSGTRNDHLLLTRDEQEAVDIIRKATSGLKAEEAVERILDLFAKTRTNREFIENAKRIRFL